MLKEKSLMATYEVIRGSLTGKERPKIHSIYRIIKAKTLFVEKGLAVEMALKELLEMLTSIVGLCAYVTIHLFNRKRFYILDTVDNNQFIRAVTKLGFSVIIEVITFFAFAKIIHNVLDLDLVDILQATLRTIGVLPITTALSGLGCYSFCFLNITTVTILHSHSDGSRTPKHSTMHA